MILVIAPLVQVAGVSRRRLLTRIPIYASASTISATVTVLALGRVGEATHLTGPVSYAIVAVLAGAYALTELGGLRLPVPSSPFRVPRRWLHAGNVGSPLLYGGAMGPGFLTATPYPAYHLWLLLIFVSGDPMIAAVTGALFGLLRGASTLVGALGGGDSHPSDARLAARVGELLAWSPALHVLNGVALMFVATCLTVMVGSR